MFINDYLWLFMIICDFDNYLLLFMIIYDYLWLLIIIYDYLWLFYGDLFWLSSDSVACINEGPSKLFFSKNLKN